MWTIWASRTEKNDRLGRSHIKNCRRKAFLFHEFLDERDDEGNSESDEILWENFALNGWWCSQARGTRSMTTSFLGFSFPTIWCCFTRKQVWHPSVLIQIYPYALMHLYLVHSLWRWCVCRQRIRSWLLPLTLSEHSMMIPFVKKDSRQAAQIAFNIHKFAVVQVDGDWPLSCTKEGSLVTFFP